MADVSTKSFGSQTVTKTTDSFSINSSSIPHSSTNVTATNVRDAIDEVATQLAVGASAPTADVTEGDLWYDTDDDQLFVRRDSSWTEMVQEDLTGDIDGGTW
jgi:hypothetical protein